MKMYKFITFSAILLVIVYPIVWQMQPLQYQKNITDFLPDTTLLYIEQLDLEEFFQDLERSKLGQAIQSIDFLEIGKELKLTDKDLLLLQKVNVIVKENWRSEVFTELFGEKMAIALLQPLKSIDQDNLIDFVKKNAILIAQPQHSAELLQIVAERYAIHKKNITISTHQYGKYFIKRISLGDETFSAVIIDGLYLISFDERQLRQCIDTYDGELSSLSEFAEYSTLRSHYSTPDQFMFLSLENNRNFITKDLLSFNYFGKHLIERELTATTGFSAFSYGAWKNESLISDRIMVLYDDEMIDTLVEKQLKIPPMICDTLKFSPPNPLIFYWTNTINFELLYQLYNRNVPENESKLNEFAATLNKLTGMNVNEFFELFGKEFTYIIIPGQKSKYFSIPYGIALFKLEQPEKLKITMEKLISHYKIPMKENSYNSRVFNSWATSSPDGMVPLYGFLDNYLFLGNSRSLAKHIIDSDSTDINLVKKQQFLDLDVGLTQTNNYISYTNNVELITLTKSLIRFAGTMIAIQNRDAAAKVRIITQNIVNPLLDGLSMFEQTTTRSYFTENSVIIDSMTEIAN